MGELWRYRELFYFLVWRDVKVRYKQTVLGALWAIIQPLGTMVVFTLFFGRLANMPSDGIPYPLFAYSALLPWTYFAGAVSSSGNSLLSNASLLRKVYFPRIALPASAAMAGLVDFLIATVVLIGLMLYYGVSPSAGVLLWPLLVGLLYFLALGVGMIFASLNVKYRDIKYALPFLVQMWLFLTPIIYPSSLVPAQYRFVLTLNPLTGIIDAFRSSLLSGRQMDLRALAVSAGMVLLLFLAGAMYFRKTERSFADLI